MVLGVICLPQPHRVRMTHSLVVYYWLYRSMEVSFFTA